MTKKNMIFCNYLFLVLNCSKVLLTLGLWQEKKYNFKIRSAVVGVYIKVTVTSKHWLELTQAGALGRLLNYI